MEQRHRDGQSRRKLERIDIRFMFDEVHMFRGFTDHANGFIMAVAIKAEGYPVTTPLIVCNTDDYAAVVAKASGTVKQGDALLELKH